MPPGAPELTRVLDRQQVRVVLYPNHNALNFRVLRFATPVHIFVGHGESGKESSVSRQLKAYDRTWIADAGSLEQLRTIRGYDVDANAVVIGSPWLGYSPPPPVAWTPDDRAVVLYAPTWEGDRPSMDYSSVENLGDAIVAAVLGDPGLRLIYRPHPWLGRVRPASAAADARIRKTIAEAQRGHIVDTGEYGWSLGVAKACVTDVSSVAHDARALAKPLLITVPIGSAVPSTHDSAFEGATRIDAQDAAGIRDLIETAIADGATAHSAPTVSLDPLLAAISDAIRLAELLDLVDLSDTNASQYRTRAGRFAQYCFCDRHECSATRGRAERHSTQKSRRWRASSGTSGAAARARLDRSPLAWTSCDDRLGPRRLDPIEVERRGRHSDGRDTFAAAPVADDAEHRRRTRHLLLPDALLDSRVRHVQLRDAGPLDDRGRHRVRWRRRAGAQARRSATGDHRGPRVSHPAAGHVDGDRGSFARSHSRGCRLAHRRAGACGRATIGSLVGAVLGARGRRRSSQPLRRPARGRAWRDTASGLEANRAPPTPLCGVRRELHRCGSALVAGRSGSR